MVKIAKDAKERLTKTTEKKFQTTMIGALDAIEKGFGYLWGTTESIGVPLTAEQRQMKELYAMVRSRILDVGNEQKRNFLNEMNRYEVKFIPYRMEITFVNSPDEIPKGNQEN
jgi:hypothetical protein